MFMGPLKKRRVEKCQKPKKSIHETADPEPIVMKFLRAFLRVEPRHKSIGSFFKLVAERLMNFGTLG